MRLAIGGGLTLGLSGCLPAVGPIADPLAMPRTAPNLFWNMARVPLPGSDRLLVWKAVGGLADLDGFRLTSDRLVTSLSGQPMAVPSAWPNPATGGLSHSDVREGTHGAGQFARHLYRRSTRHPGLDVRPNPSETLSIIWTDASMTTLAEVQHAYYFEGPDVSEDFPPGSLSLKRSKVRRQDGGYDETIAADRLDYNAPGTEASWIGKLVLTTQPSGDFQGNGSVSSREGFGEAPGQVTIQRSRQHGIDAAELTFKTGAQWPDLRLNVGYGPQGQVNRLTFWRGSARHDELPPEEAPAPWIMPTVPLLPQSQPVGGT